MARYSLSQFTIKEAQYLCLLAQGNLEIRHVANINSIRLVGLPIPATSLNLPDPAWQEVNYTLEAVWDAVVSTRPTPDAEDASVGYKRIEPSRKLIQGFVLDSEDVGKAKQRQQQVQHTSSEPQQGTPGRLYPSFTQHMSSSVLINDPSARTSTNGTKTLSKELKASAELLDSGLRSSHRPHSIYAELLQPSHLTGTAATARPSALSLEDTRIRPFDHVAQPFVSFSTGTTVSTSTRVRPSVTDNPRRYLANLDPRIADEASKQLNVYSGAEDATKIDHGMLVRKPDRENMNMS